MMFRTGAAARVENKGYLCDLCKTLHLRKRIDGRLEDDATWEVKTESIFETYKNIYVE